jgi:hypothetical protein
MACINVNGVQGKTIRPILKGVVLVAGHYGDKDGPRVGVSAVSGDMAAAVALSVDEALALADMIRKAANAVAEAHAAEQDWEAIAAEMDDDYHMDTVRGL